MLLFSSKIPDESDVEILNDGAVLVAEENFAKIGKYALLTFEGKSFVSKVKSDPRISPKNIAMNINHRKFLNCQLSGAVSCEPVLEVPELTLVEFKVTLNVKPTSEVIINEKELRSSFSDSFVSSFTLIRKSLTSTVLLTPVYVVPRYGNTTKNTVIKFFSENPLIRLSGKLSEEKYSKQLIITPDIDITTELFRDNLDLKNLGIGGLDTEFEEIFRRAFASRSLPPDLVKNLGIKHSRGILLYGPPGCGKTLLARQIGKVLNCVEPKIVNGPSLLNKYVGQSEQNVRELFIDAEKDSNKNRLHLIICDEFDSLGGTRTTGSDTGSQVSNNIVNQFLSKIDGVDSLENILLICMTNRKDIIDPAVLRPGRLDVQIEISLPDEKGRLEILQIHTTKLKTNGSLSDTVDLERIAEKLKGYTGAELEGIVRAATTYAIRRETEIEDGHIKKKPSNILVNSVDFDQAISHDVKPMFGESANEIRDITCRTKFVQWCEEIGRAH